MHVHACDHVGFEPIKHLHRFLETARSFCICWGFASARWIELPVRTLRYVSSASASWFTRGKRIPSRLLIPSMGRRFLTRSQHACGPFRPREFIFMTGHDRRVKI